MKLPLLLAQFLYQNHKLNLPGIGSFAMDPNIAVPEEKEKDPPSIPAGISFQNKSIYQPDDDLVEYIKANTGKMKSLAASDLESFITLGTQMLNIGKPLFLEGIGTLVKTKSGSFDFTPGVYTTTKLEDLNTERSEKKKSVFEESRDEYQPQSNVLRKLFLVVAILGGLFIIGWGGYKLYKKNMHQESDNSTSLPQNESQSQDTTTNTQNQVILQPDSSAAKKTETSPANPVIPKPEILPAKQAATKSDTALFRVVIFETNEKEKAVSRFAELHLEKAKLYTKDSATYKIIFYKHAAPKDTTELKQQFSEAFSFPVRLEKIVH